MDINTLLLKREKKIEGSHKATTTTKFRDISSRYICIQFKSKRTCKLKPIYIYRPKYVRPNTNMRIGGIFN